MIVLAIDTALGACSVAIIDGARTLAHRLVLMERGHAEALAPMVEEAMNEAGITFDAIERLGVTTGPGTFTGQRVGLAFMRGLRIALSRPLIGVTTLAAMAEHAVTETKLSRVAAIHDARRGEVYLEIVEASRTLQSASLLEFAEAIRLLTARSAGVLLALAGTAAPRMADTLKSANIDCVLSTIRQPDALYVARLATRSDATDIPPRPLYLRAPDAKLPPPRP